ncbi:MAG: hypothetical protein MI867_20720 [Pseudomonadales bacterium]|nr:hypothetical protein [Pseudomonadales bacterium]
MTTRLTLCFFVLFWLLPVAGHAEVVVIVNKENQATNISRQQLVDLYMGRNIYFSDGNLALRIDQTPKSSERSEFYLRLVGKTVPEVNAYWARLLFTGRASPPHVVESTDKILEIVSNNRYAIAYIEKSELNDSVKVLESVEF